ncbi:MAG: PspA/IM30 family protein [Rhizobiaceae bacterium]|nr:PspA/IM30 family protein [Rhizobiaceae bacterium]
MFKSMFALIRGTSHEAAQNVADRNAMVILRQQIRDSAEAVTSAKKAVAIATAQNEQEKRQHAKLIERIEDLEIRTISALENGETELAKEAAEAIAILEAERDASAEAQKSFTTEIERLKRVVLQSESRLRDLKRGHRIADATDKTQRLRQSAPNTGLSALQDAESTLTRLRERQMEMDAAANVLDDMAKENNPDAIAQKLSEAGCGAPITSTADQVLARLQTKSGKKSKKSD